MLVFLNGRFVNEEEALVSIFDRGLLYGDGLFEAIRIYAGEPFLWAEHLQRFEQGAAFLGINPTLKPAEMRAVITRLVEENRMQECICRILLSRGSGPRGYSPKGALTPTLAISLHPVPSSQVQPWRAIISMFTLQAEDPISFFKHCNKLRQVLAKAEADAAGVNEALLCNTEGFVVEGTTTNLFWISHGTICTPPMHAGILPGTTRSYLLGLCRRLGLKTHETSVTARDLLRAEGVFLTSCGVEIVPLAELDGAPLPFSAITNELRKVYRT